MCLPDTRGGTQLITVDTSKPWCVFTHSIKGACIYVGFDKTDRALNTNLISDILRWQELLKANGGLVDISIFQQYATREEAQLAFRQVVNTLKPECNIFRGQRAQKQPKIQCLNDGKVYDNSAIAARAYGIAPSSMSNHLNGRAGYTTIHERTFKRI